MSILVLNAGSSSLKFSVFGEPVSDVLAAGSISWTSDAGHAELRFRLGAQEERRASASISDHAAATRQVLGGAELDLLQASGAASWGAVGHRVVHGGTRFQDPVRIDTEVKGAIRELSLLAPLHNPPALAVIQAAEQLAPGVPQVAVFDTSFFSRLLPEAHIFALPYEWYERWGIRRFGFHGISHSYCAIRTAELVGRGPSGLRVVVCHLGNGCSAAAIRDGFPVATTMGFTPVDGLMMGTRSGTVDPGIVTFLQQRHGMNASQIEEALNYQSGLLGVSGISRDFREVEAAAQNGHERARLALRMYADRVRSTIGSLAVQLPGMDALVFTAGVGENSAALRAAVCDGLEFLGVMLDARRNTSAQPDCDVAAADSPVRVLVIRTREDLMIARSAACLLTESTGGR